MTKEAIHNKSILPFGEISLNSLNIVMTSASQDDLLLNAILDLLSNCTGVPSSSLPHQLKKLNPSLVIDDEDVDLQTIVFELFGSQKLNLETWFIQENLAENYLLSWCVIDNEDLVRPSRSFIRQPFPENHHCEVSIYKNIKVSHFYFYLKPTKTENDVLEELLDRMQEVYPSTHNPSPTLSSSAVRYYPPLLPTLATGVLCAVLNYQQWARARIISVEQNTVKVDLVDDCGTLKISLPTSNLRILPTEFRNIPRRKLRACFCTTDLTSEEATNNRVLLAVHRNWRAYRVERVAQDPVNVRPEHSFLGNLKVTSDDAMTSTNHTLVFYPVFEETPGAVK